jgi:hypothetical protein
MAYPKRTRGTRICLDVTKEGVALYGNRAAFKALATWMTWIAASKPSEHYECHVVWQLFNHFGKPNVFLRFDEETRRVYAANRKKPIERFELTFMQVESADLDEMERLSRKRRPRRSHEG